MLHHKARDWLMLQGIREEFADTDARLFTAAFYGLQFDFVVRRTSPRKPAKPLS